MIRFACPTCGRTITAEDQHIGRKGKCPNCGGAFVVPASSETADVPAPAAPPAPVVPSAAPAPAASAPAAAPHPAPSDPPAPSPAPARSRSKWILAASAVALVAAGVGMWQLNRPHGQGPAGPGNRSSGGQLASSTAPAASDPASASSPANAPHALPTREDGRFSNRIRLSTRIEKTYYPDAPSAFDGEQMFVLRVVDGKVTAVPADQQPSGAPRFRPMNDPVVRLLGLIDQNLRAPMISPDGKRVAHVRPLSESRQVVVVDGKQGAEYRCIVSFIFSPDGQRHAYVARTASDGMVAVVDGNEQKPYSDISLPIRGFPPEERDRDGIQFSPDSRHIAYIARPKNDKPEQVLVVDGEEKPLATRSAFDLTWSPDGRRIAYVAVDSGRNSLYETTTVSVHVDGNKDKGYQHISRGSLRFSADGGRMAYVAGAGPKGPVFAVENGVEGKPYSYIFPLSVQYNPRGQLEYDAIAGGEPMAVVGVPMNFADSEISGKRIHVCAGVETEGFRQKLCYSADGNHSAWAVYRDKKYFVIQDGNPSDEGYHGVWCLRLSPDGRHCAFVGASTPFIESSSKLVIDGMEMPFPLKGRIEKLRYVAADTLRLALRGENDCRLLEVKIRPAPPTPELVALSAIKGSEAAEQKVALLRKIAAADRGQRFNLLQSIPLAYALAGEKEPALAAFDACEAQLAVEREPFTTAAGSYWMTVNPPDPARRDLRRADMVALLVGALVAKGDKATAAQLATQLATEAAGVDAIQAKENWDLQRNVAAALGAVGDVAGLEKFMQAVQTEPKLRSELISKCAVALAQTGDGAGACRIAATLADPEARAGALETIGMVLERKGDRAGAADASCNLLLAGTPRDPFGRSVYADLARTGGIAALQRFHQAMPADLRKQKASLVRGALAQIRSEGGTAMALEVLGLVEAGDGDLAQLADHCWQSILYPDGDAAWRKGMVAAAVRLGALDPDDCASMKLFHAIATRQRSERDKAGLAETVAQAARAYRGKCRSSEQTPFMKMSLLAEMQLWAGDKAGAAQTLKDVPAGVSPGDLPTLARLQAQAGEAAAAETMQKIKQWIETLSDEGARNAALAALADAQTAGGDLKGAAETLARCSPGINGAGAPVLAYARLVAAQFTKGDKAGAEEIYIKAAAFAGADGAWKQASVRGAVAAVLVEAGDLKGAVDMLDREKDRQVRLQDLLTAVTALLDAGEVDTVKVLLTADRGSSRGCAGDVRVLLLTRARTGNYKAMLQLTTRPASAQHQTIQVQAWWAIMAAIRAGEIDEALSSMEYWEADVLTGMVQIRLDARDDAGAKRILEWARDKPMVRRTVPPDAGESLEFIADLMQEAGFNVEADETLAMAVKHVNKYAGTTRPSTPPVKRAHNPFRDFDSPNDAPIVRRMVRAGDLDEVLYWARSLNGGRQYAICSAAMEAVLDRPEVPRRPAEAGSRLRRRTP